MEARPTWEGYPGQWDCLWIIIIEFGAIGEGGWVDAVLKSGDTIQSWAWKGPFTTRLESDASVAIGKLHFTLNT